MRDRAMLLAICLTLGLAGCGGGGGVGNTAAGSPTDYRLASEGATLKPWESDSTSPSVDAASLVPDKQAASSSSAGQAGAGAGAASAAQSSAAQSAAPTATSTGAVVPYDPQALPVIGGEPSSSSTWPAWRLTMSRWQWKQLNGTDLSSVVPDPAVPGDPRGRIDAWNGLAADTRTSRLFAAANGGHADYSGNEVYEIDLSVDSPRWRMLRAPTPAADILGSNKSKGIFNDYYRDGRPASTHTYYALQFLATRNAIFKFGSGSLWGTGNEANWKTDAFSLSNNDWQPAGTWPDVVPGSRVGVIAASTCKNPATDEVYIAAPSNLRRFNPASGVFEVLTGWLDNSTAVYARACAYDTARNRVVFFGDAYRPPNGGLVYDVASNTLSRISFSGDGAAEIAEKDSYHFAWYEPKIGKFLVKTNLGDHLYAVDPETFSVTAVGTSSVSTLPNAFNGVHSRWQRLPKLGGYAYYPVYGSGVWFLAIE
mgnify:CR=1 FL=1